MTLIKGGLNMSTIAEISPELEQFIKTLPSDKKASNVYEIICEDMDGNITERKFGVNVMTDTGFYNEYRYNYNIYNIGIFIGTGSGTPSVTDTRLFQIVPNSIRFGEELTEAGEYIYDNTYDSSTHMIIGRRRTGRITMDYNYSWAPNDINITEFGEASGGSVSDYTLFTHCLIYDQSHQPSYFTKRINEKVTIDIYRSECINADLFDTLWNEGKYFFINPCGCVRGPYQGRWCRPQYGLVFGGRCRVENDYPLFPAAYNNKHGADMGGYTCNALNTGFTSWVGGLAASVDIGNGHGNGGYNTVHEDGYRSNFTLPATVLQNKDINIYGITLLQTWQNLDRWWDGSGDASTKGYQYAYWYVLNNLTTPEEIVHDNCYTDDFMHFTFNNIFDQLQLTYESGGRGTSYLFYKNTSLPANDFHITACKRYNALTDDYDIVETFVDDPDYDFRNPERSIWGSYYCRAFTSEAGSHWYNVAINSNPAAILSFLDPSTSQIYLTDKFWDPTTFVKLDDNRTVPQALQHKKYIIKAPYQTGNAGADGVHAIRERNKHALVPTAPVTIDVDFKPSNTGYNDLPIHASDEGWIYQDHKIIYPESDDGTGHPYVYQISQTGNVDRWLNKFYDNHIVFIDQRRYIRPNDSTNPRIKILTLDPDHPDVDPNTTFKYYYDNEIKAFFGETGESNAMFYEYLIMITDKKHNYLLLLRGTHEVGYIDVVNQGPIAGFPNTSDFTAIRTSLVYDSDYMVSYIQKTETDYVFKIYDMLNETIYDTFTIPLEGSMSIYGIFAYSSMVYIQIYRDNTTYYLYTYDINTGQITPYPGIQWFNLMEYYRDSSYYYLNQFDSRYTFDDEAFAMCVCYEGSADVNGSRFILIFKNDLSNPCYFDIYKDWPQNTRHQNAYLWITYYQPELKKFNGGKDYVLLVRGRLPHTTEAHNYTSHVAWNVFDIGRIRNKGWRTPDELRNNMPTPLYRMPNAPTASGGANTSDPNVAFPYTRVSSSVCWYSLTTFYKNKVYVATTFDKPKLYDIASFLPHQLTGTTKSIQTYNNPKRIGAHSHGLVITNDIQ